MKLAVLSNTTNGRSGRGGFTRVSSCEYRFISGTLNSGITGNKNSWQPAPLVPSCGSFSRYSGDMQKMALQNGVPSRWIASHAKSSERSGKDTLHTRFHTSYLSCPPSLLLRHHHHHHHHHHQQQQHLVDRRDHSCCLLSLGYCSLVWFLTHSLLLLLLLLLVVVVVVVAVVQSRCSGSSLLNLPVRLHCSGYRCGAGRSSLVSPWSCQYVFIKP